jgi:hypothetical protein
MASDGELQVKLGKPGAGLDTLSVTEVFEMEDERSSKVQFELLVDLRA